jgi:glucose/arabinose dehydrogenase
VRLVKNGVLQPTPFIDISDRVNGYWDRGLLGVAVDPEFTTNGYVYLLYTYENDPLVYNGTKTGRLTRVTAVGDTASPSTEVILLGSIAGSTCNGLPPGSDCIVSESPSHSVGGLWFDLEGHLFVSLGEGAHFNNVNDDALRSQDLTSFAGKILRITRDGQGLPSNPFYTGDPNAVQSKIFAYGLRNPFRFSLRPGTLVPYVGDVGWNTTEEVNVAVPGANLGWPCYEGGVKQAGYSPKTVCQTLYAAGASAVKPPLIGWAHNGLNSASVGGIFYTATAYPSNYHGAYFYADYARNWIRYAHVDASNNLTGPSAVFATGLTTPVQLALDAEGNLLYLSIGMNAIRRIRYSSGNTPPIAVASANPTSGNSPIQVSFSSSGSRDPDNDALSYSWNFGDGSPQSTLPNPVHEYTASGTHTAVLTVTDARGGSNSATVTITVGNSPPTIAVVSPTPEFRYKVGDVVHYAATVTDSDDGTIPESKISWKVVIKHCPNGTCHEHTLLTSTGSAGSFTVPDHGDDSYFQLVVTAEDSAGLKRTSSMNVSPQTVQLSIATVPAGLKFVLDGTTRTAPYTRQSISGSTHTVNVASPQTLGDKSYNYSSWSDSGARQHNITVSSDTTLTANFVSAVKVTVSPTYKTLSSNQSQQFSVVVSGTTNKAVTWSLSPEIGTISATGLYRAPEDVTSSIDVIATATSVSDPSKSGTTKIYLRDLAPAISDIQVVNLTATTAEIAWTTNEPADSQVQFGTTTAYGRSTPVDPARKLQHRLTVTGLSPSTLYNFRVRSKDASNKVALSPNRTFTTLAQ